MDDLLPSDLTGEALGSRDGHHCTCQEASCTADAVMRFGDAKYCGKHAAVLHIF